VEVSEHIEVLRLEGERMAAAAGVAGPEAPVPTCPDWVVRDLVRHTGAVHRWATGVVATPHTEVPRAGLEEVAGTWPTDADLVEWFAEGHAGLVAALSAAPADLECWTFLRATSPLAHWARRQAHETTVHRVDSELAAGSASSPIDAVFAADGVDELLCGFVPRRSTKVRAERPTSLRVRSTDAGTAWLVQLDSDGVTSTREDESAPSPAGADCTVAGAAGDLYLALWNRGRQEDLTVEGDDAVLAHFLDSVQVR
jgi:uncharacterized protein (TIGR03083 family)